MRIVVIIRRGVEERREMRCCGFGREAINVSPYTQPMFVFFDSVCAVREQVVSVEQILLIDEVLRSEGRHDVGEMVIHEGPSPVPFKYRPHSFTYVPDNSLRCYRRTWLKRR